MTTQKSELRGSRYGAWTLALFSLLSLLWMGCVSPGVESRLRTIEVRQDSILNLLTSMQDKHEFMAMRMGWRPPPDTTPKDIPIGDSYTRGPANAKVTLVEFSDLECPYCAQISPVLDSVAKAFPNDVRVVFKHFPLSFHPKAREAAAAAIAAGKQGKFFEFRSIAGASYRNLGDSLYDAVAQQIGLDMERFKREKALTPEVNRLLDKDMELGRKVGVEGTPTIFVNGRLATNRSFEYFAQFVKP
jgi:protein-disulfide isomerase